jgi:hypothetical protein
MHVDVLCILYFRSIIDIIDRISIENENISYPIHVFQCIGNHQYFQLHHHSHHKMNGFHIQGFLRDPITFQVIRGRYMKNLERSTTYHILFFMCKRNLSLDDFIFIKWRRKYRHSHLLHGLDIQHGVLHRSVLQ